MCVCVFVCGEWECRIFHSYEKQWGESNSGVFANELKYDIVVNEFEPWLRYYVYFQMHLEKKSALWSPSYGFDNISTVLISERFCIE